MTLEVPGEPTRRVQQDRLPTPMKCELRLHAAEWDAVDMALSAYIARMGDVFATLEVSDELSSDMASTMLMALRLATRTVRSLHDAIAAAREKRERADRWKRGKGRARAPVRTLVRHQAVELIPCLLRDFGTQLKAMGDERASITFLRLGKVIGATLA